MWSSATGWPLTSRYMENSPKLESMPTLCRSATLPQETTISKWRVAATIRQLLQLPTGGASAFGGLRAIASLRPPSNFREVPVFRSHQLPLYGNERLEWQIPTTTTGTVRKNRMGFFTELWECHTNIPYMEFLYKNWFQNTNLSIHIARFSASESPRAIYQHSQKSPIFAGTWIIAWGDAPWARLRMRQHPKQSLVSTFWIRGEEGGTVNRQVCILKSIFKQKFHFKNT